MRRRSALFLRALPAYSPNLWISHLSKSPPTEKLIERAEKLVELGQLERALAAYRKLVEVHDGDSVLWTRIAALCVQLGRMGEAAKSYEKVAQLQARQSSAAPPAEPTATKDEAALLLGEADSFLRLGLIDKAVEHLAEALRRNPLLRVREPLVKLYVTQRQYKSAIAELWALLTPCANPQEEIRFLRYIIRLGDPDRAAEQRLKEIIGRRQLEPAAPQEEPAEPKLSVTAIGQELREFLGTHRPATDLAPTLVFSAAETERYLNDDSPPPSAATRPNAAEVEAVAEEIALSSGGLKAELKEVERSLQQRRHAEALRRLQSLAVRYPHSKAVQVQLQPLKVTVNIFGHGMDMIGTNE